MKVFLDTHVLLWLYQRNQNLLSQKALNVIDNSDLFLPAFAHLEIQFLYEIGKIKAMPNQIIEDLKENIDLISLHINVSELVQLACKFTWTRDPFDRLIVAETELNNSYLLTRDEKIRKNFVNTVW